MLETNRIGLPVVHNPPRTTRMEDFLVSIQIRQITLVKIDGNWKMGLSFERQEFFGYQVKPGVLLISEQNLCSLTDTDRIVVWREGLHD